MSDGGVINIGSQHAGGNIYNIAGDMTINKGSSAN